MTLPRDRILEAGVEAGCWRQHAVHLPADIDEDAVGRNRNHRAFHLFTAGVVGLFELSQDIAEGGVGPRGEGRRLGRIRCVGLGHARKLESLLLCHRLRNVGRNMPLWGYPGGRILAMSLNMTSANTIMMNTNPTLTMASLIRRLKSRRSSISTSSMRMPPPSITGIGRRLTIARFRLTAAISPI